MAQDDRKPFVRYSFFKVEPEWRRLPEAQRQQGKTEFIAAADKLSSQMEVRWYNLLGTRGDVDFMLWQISPTLESLQELAAGILNTGLGKYVKTPYSYLAMTRPSPYLTNHGASGHSHRGGAPSAHGAMTTYLCTPL